MKTWFAILGGLGIWAVHFFGLYLVEEFITGDGRPVSWMLTLGCLAAVAALAITLHSGRLAPEPWARRTGLAGAALAAVAIAWQGLPLIIL